MRMNEPRFAKLIYILIIKVGVQSISFENNINFTKISRD